MRHEDAGLQLWLATDRLAREERDAELARIARLGIETPSLRQRAGQVMIALGERLAGDHLDREQRRVSEAPRRAARAF